MTNLSEVIIVAGGLSHERDVSIRSGRRVSDALNDASISTATMDLNEALIEHLTQQRPGVVWPLLHGAHGEDGAFRDVLDLLGMAYVGSPGAACRTAWDKPAAKTLLAREGIDTPDFVALPTGIFRELGAQAVMSAITKRLGLPLVVKPARGGSALGVSVVKSPEALSRAMVDCFAYDDIALVERYVDGHEIAVSILNLGEGPQALPIVEIVPDGGIYDYDARYTAGATEFFCPARLSADVTEAVRTAALRTHEALGFRDMSRVDMIVDTDGTPWVLEANSAPGMTETSLLPQSIEAAGMSAGEVYTQLVRQAQKRG